MTPLRRLLWFFGPLALTFLLHWLLTWLGY